MRTRTLSDFASSDIIEHLITLVMTVKAHHQGRRVAATTENPVSSDAGFSMSEGLRELGCANVLKVREAKDRLPTLLNNAAAGEISFVSAGRGGSVVIMGTKVLADALATMEEEGAMTVADAIAGLPYEPSELRPLPMPRGQQPRRGWLDLGVA